MDSGQNSDVHPSAAEDEGETVEIRIKTLDAQSYTLRVGRNTSVPSLKDQIASVVGVPVENQRLICRGKVLKDDQLLGSYNVEDGHTLHLVARQPPQPSPPSSTSGQEQATRPIGPSDMIMSPRNRPGHVSHSLLMGTINIPDTGEGGMPDLNRIISAVLNSVGLGNGLPAGTGAGPGGSVAVGVLPPTTQVPGSDGQAHAEGADVSSQGARGDQNDSIDDIEAQLQLDAIYGVPSPGMFGGAGGAGGAIPSNYFRVMQQPAVVPDALTTMSQYLDRLEQSFFIIEGGGVHNAGPPASERSIQLQMNSGSGQTSESGQTVGIAQSSSLGPSPPVHSSFTNPTGGSGGPSSAAPAGPVAAPRRLPAPSSLGTIVSRVQHLLSDQAGTALARLAAQLENEPNLVDATAREEMQRTALRDGNMMQQLGALLLELGRTTLTLRMGQSPAESVVNAGPAVFISPSGPNPMMVQSLPSQTGVALGVLPSGTPQANGGIVAPSVGPRSINIHIHTSDLRLPSPSATPPSQQPPPRAVIGVTSGAPIVTVRNLMERADASNPEHALTVRQIIERAEAASGVQQGNAELNPQLSGGPVQGAIMTFNENGAMRVVPVRTRTAAVPIGTSSHPGNESDAIFQPLVARLQQHLGPAAQHGRSASTPPGSTSTAATNVSRSTSSGEHPAASGSSPSVRAQVHIQAWAPSIIQALGGVPSQFVSSQPISSGAPPGDTVPPAATGHGPAGGTTASRREDPIAPVSNDRASDGVSSGQLQEGLGQGVDVSQIVDSLGPFLNQLAVAFHQARPQTAHQSPSQQHNEQSAPSELNIEGSTVNIAAATASPSTTPEISGPSPQDRNGVAESSVYQPNPGAGLTSEDNMDVSEKTENVIVSQDGPGNSSTSTLSAHETFLDEKLPQEGETQPRVGDQAVAPPVGLGLGGLQPLPTRTRRRGNAPRPVQRADTGAAAAAGNGLPAARGREQTLTPVVTQNLSQISRLSNRSEGNAMEQLLPLLGSLGNRGSAQGGEGNREMGDVMGRLIARTTEGSGGQGPFSGDMLRGMMGQLVQSPLMENLVQQVMTGVQNDETRSAENSLPGDATISQGIPGAFDFAGIVQQMLPVMSQMFGDRPVSNAAQQVPSSTNVRNHNDGGAARNSPGPINDSGRWREALSEEEIASWSETISADVEEQRSMEPQRPFSDVYVRGSPLAKRQKTELEGNAQKLENGGLPEDVSRVDQESAPARVGGSNDSTNGAGISQSAQQTAVQDGMGNTPILVMIPSLQLQPETSNSRRRPRSQLEEEDDSVQ